jgi:hypothetical protein
VAGIYPNDRALIRLAGMLLIEQNGELLVQRRYRSDDSIRLVLFAERSEDPRSNNMAMRSPPSTLLRNERPEDEHQLDHTKRLDLRAPIETWVRAHVAHENLAVLTPRAGDS